MGDSMEGLSEMGERRSRVASNSSLAQVANLILIKTKEMKRCMYLSTEDGRMTLTMVSTEGALSH